MNLLPAKKFQYSIGNANLVVCSAYDLMLSDAMNDLQEQVKVEHVPAEKNEQGVAVGNRYHLSLNDCERLLIVV